MKKFRTRDSSLSYFVNQLENLDKRLYEPLVSVSWGRDIKLRGGISMSNESTSFIQSTLAASGTLQNATGNMSFIGAATTAIPGISINGAKVVTPLRLLAREISYTSVELERSAALGQSLDTQQTDGMNLVYQMNTDQMVYVGATEVGATGLLNSSLVTSGLVATGAGGSTLWVNKTPDEILADINTLLISAWQASGYAVMPSKLLLPPAQMGYISTQKVSSAGTVSILKYVMENCIALNINGSQLDIQPVKWLPGLGAGATNRMVAYTNEENRVRFPMVPIRRETAYYHGIRFAAPYIWAFGQVEFVYPETVQYADGI